MDTKITRAVLRGPAGQVEIRRVDRSTPGVGPYLPPGGILIPVAPLQAGTIYEASVTVKASGVTLSRNWSVTTG